jgi:hypothetical protein
LPFNRRLNKGCLLYRLSLKGQFVEQGEPLFPLFSFSTNEETSLQNPDEYNASL